MPLTNTPETLNILNPDFRMPEHCGGDRWSILHGDSLQILRQLEPNSFDAIITDHAPHAAHEKETPFEDAKNGITGLDKARRNRQGGVLRACTLPAVTHSGMRRTTRSGRANRRRSWLKTVAVPVA